jgi:hypothetical protein
MLRSLGHQASDWQEFYDIHISPIASPHCVAPMKRFHILHHPDGTLTAVKEGFSSREALK